MPAVVKVLGVVIGVPTACCKPRSSYPPSDNTVEHICFNLLDEAVAAVFVI